LKIKQEFDAAIKALDLFPEADIINKMLEGIPYSTRFEVIRLALIRGLKYMERNGKLVSLKKK
jgi:hypothetical protein